MTVGKNFSQLAGVSFECFLAVDGCLGDRQSGGS
jgi:hypothetical protein